MQTEKLNLIPGSVLPVVNVSQYDKGRHFALQIYEGATAYDLTGKDVQIRGTKPDGNGFAYDSTDGAISVSGSTVTVSTLQQMTACGGQTMCELRITESGVILGTLNFILMVEPSALSDDTPISDTDIPAIERDFEAALAEAEADALIAEGYAKGTQDGVPATSGEPYYQDNAKYYKEQAEAAASGGGADALKAEGYAVGTQNGVPVTSGSPYYHNNAAYYEGEASTSATNAATSETNAGLSETAAGNSATAASGSASAAAASALVSEGWANGEQNGTPVSSGSPYYQNNAKYWKDQAAQYAAGGLTFQGSVAFASIPTTGLSNGDMYNITDDFTTDSRFIDGAGISVKAGTDIAWVDSVSKWDLLSPGGGSGSLSGLTDVTITSVATGQVLAYDGSKWVNTGLTIPSTLSALSDVTLSTPSSDQLLKYDGSKWVNGQDALSKLSDVTLTTPSSGQFLKYDGAKWVNGTGGGGASALDDLTDVDITTPTDGQVLTYDADSQKWVNADGGGGGGFDYKDWLAAANIPSAGFADLAAVLADEETVWHLMSVHAAVDYLTGFPASDASIGTILNDNIAAKWINLRDYALDKLEYAFSAVMESAGKYGYGEWAKLSESPETWGPKGNVPIMTANNAPYGVASAYQVFDGNSSTTASGTDFSYQFVNPICPKSFECKDTGGNAITGGTLQGSNDGSTWETPQSGKYYLYLRVHFGSSTTVATVQFYGRELKVSVPTMTSNTAPYGVCVYSSEDDANTKAYKAFDGDDTTYWSAHSAANERVGYHFTTPICPKMVIIKPVNGNRVRNYKIQGSNDGITWADLYSGVHTENQAVSIVDLTANTTAYGYLQILVADTYGGYIRISTLQFYGEYLAEYDWDADNPRHTLYDHGLELESMAVTGWTTGSYTTVPAIKEPSYLYLPASGGSSTNHCVAGTTNKIDLTNYSLLRMESDRRVGYSSGDMAGAVKVLSTKDTASNVISTLNLLEAYVKNNCPYNIGLDISSISGSYYIAAIAGFMSREFSYNELWLE